MHHIKIKRALAKSTIGDCPASAAAILDVIPDSVIAALTSAQLAALIDANWRLAQASKAMADREAIDAGAVWDARRKRLVDLAINTH